MPQMSPMAWINLMIMFIVMIMAVNSMMYFNKSYNNKKILKKKMTKLMNWEW